jgi:hypothetical protein
MTKHLYICFLFSVVLLVQGQVIAQEKFLYVSVINANKSAVSGISITCTGCSTELVNQGSAKISLPLQTRPGDATFLRVVRRSVRNPEWIIVSPPDGKVFVPSFTGSNAITVIVAIKSYPQILRGPKAIKDKDIKAIVEKTLKNNRALDGQVSDQEFDLALKMQAKAFGVTPEEVVRAIHVWAAKVKDPYDKGLAALFDKKYAEATNLLTISYELRKESVDEFVNAAYFLGQSLWQQGKYKEAVEKLQQVVVFRKDDSGVLNWLGLGLSYSGNYPEAETIYRRAIGIWQGHCRNRDCVKQSRVGMPVTEKIY